MVIVVVIIAAAGLYFFTKPKDLSPNISPVTKEKKETKPSETFIEYTDPAGFSFSYPDNVSISNVASDDSADMIDPNSYADLQLFSKDVSGSINIKIADSKFKTLNDWLKANDIPNTNKPSDKTLGSLKAFEVKTSDRLMLAAIDQGVLFTVEMPLVEQDFWSRVYDKVLADFSFAVPETTTITGAASAVSSDEIVFEGEEVIE